MDNSGLWTLHMPDGLRKEVYPLQETEDGCIEMRNGIKKATDYSNFVVGVLIFTDMPRNERMERAAREHHHVYIIWGLDNLAEDLQRIAREVGIKRPPTPRIAENEWSRVNELQYLSPAGLQESGQGTQDSAPGPATVPEGERQLTLGSATINIHHVGTLVIQHSSQEQDTDGKTFMSGW